MARFTRRSFISGAASTAIAAGSFVFSKERRRRPNVIILLTDDQGYGDLGCHGNGKIKTPHLDRFAKESVELTQFHACPICNPSRASLLTGLYHYRVGVGDNHDRGKQMMYGETVTLAEMLAAAGYKTAIFGKWHLGDNYPMRSMDQGFQESLVFRGSNIGSGNSKFNPVLMHNGKEVQTKRYSTDVYFGAAIHFIEKNQRQPFLVYLAADACHVPLDVPEEYAAPYRRMGLPEGTARVYGMITNLDDNFARLMAKLKELGLERDTMVVYLSDNGADFQPGQRMPSPRFNAGLRGHKGQVYEGAIRVPFFVRWPAELKADSRVDRVAAHIDLVPTLLEACDAEPPPSVPLDGRSLMPLLRADKSAWPDRNLFFQMLRDVNREYAVRSQKYKLVQPPGEVRYALYDMDSDPGEQRDISVDNPTVVAQLHNAYQNWYRDVVSPSLQSLQKDAPRADLGSPYENPVILSWTDRRGLSTHAYGRDALGHWDVNVVQSGKYKVVLHFPKAEKDGVAQFKLGEVHLEKPFPKEAASALFESVNLRHGKGKLEAIVKFGERRSGVPDAEVEKLNE